MLGKSIKNVLHVGEAKNRVLHLTWFAFFLTFAIWFSHAPLLAYIKLNFHLTDQQIKALLIINLAFTIPARILVGILVDSLGPRVIYSTLLVLGGVTCVAFACASTYEQLAVIRFLLGFIGAGFVVGIRLIAEWFPARQLGLAEGIYGGWGNFGAAAGALFLPSLSLLFGGENGWRFALISLGIFTSGYGFVFYHFIRDAPDGKPFAKARRSSGMEVSSWRDLWLLLLMNIPMYLALALLVWKLSPSGVNLLSQHTVTLIWFLLAGLFIFQARHLFAQHSDRFSRGVPREDCYKFKQVAILNFSYLVTFGSELAVVSMLPLFLMETFPQLNLVSAGLLAAMFAVMNIIARPSGGLMSDSLGRRRVLVFLMAGVALGYLLLSKVEHHWWLSAVITVCVLCAFFVQAGCGAVFAMVPLVKRGLTGRIAGMTGAYGNVGGVFYLTLLSLMDYKSFFFCIAVSALIGVGLCFFLEEPLADHSDACSEPHSDVNALMLQ